jgi:hypothetical protein
LWIALTSRRTGSSMSRVVLMMFDDRTSSIGSRNDSLLS